jgi:hypothetical protein
MRSYPEINRSSKPVADARADTYASFSHIYHNSRKLEEKVKKIKA